MGLSKGFFLSRYVCAWTKRDTRCCLKEIAIVNHSPDDGCLLWSIYWTQSIVFSLTWNDPPIPKGLKQRGLKIPIVWSGKKSVLASSYWTGLESNCLYLLFYKIFSSLEQGGQKVPAAEKWKRSCHIGKAKQKIGVSFLPWSDIIYAFKISVGVISYRVLCT